MPDFQPFSGLRYDGEILNFVVCPPYDVVSEAERKELIDLDRNIAAIEIPEESESGYKAAAEILQSWRDDGTLLLDGESFYIYKMGFSDANGILRQTSGVLGALTCFPKPTDILPHEQTVPKAKTDRLELLRATRTNVSPIWALTPTVGFSALCETTGPPTATATLDEVHHRIWKVETPATLQAIREAVASSVLVVADGHHRFQTAINYATEREQAGTLADSDTALLTYVSELSSDNIYVEAIHRLVNGISFDDIVGLPFDVEPIDYSQLDSELEKQQDMIAFSKDKAAILRPKSDVSYSNPLNLDSELVEFMKPLLPNAQIWPQHGTQNLKQAVEDGSANVALALKPATAQTIAETARTGHLMPPKTTFFYPKLATGMVLRSLDD